MRTASRALAALSAAAALAAPAQPRAQSAFQQLQEACRQSGGDCNPSIPAPSAPTPTPAQGGGSGVQQGEAVQSTRASQSTGHRNVQQQPQRQVVQRAPPRKTTDQQIREAVTLGLVQGLLSALLAPPPAAVSTGPTREELEEQAERERQRVAEFQARVALVNEQRATRDSQQTSNMDALAATMSAGWDRPTDVADGPAGAVALEGTTPSLFAPPVYRSPRAAPPSPAVKRLAELAAESEDVAVLSARFSELSAQLEAAKRDADAIGRMSRNRVEEYEQMERTVAQGVADAWDRGLSLATEGLLLGHAKAIGHVEKVQSNERAWNGLKSLLHDAQRGAAFLDDAEEQLETLEQARSDASFLTRQRNFKEDVVYLAERFGGPYAEQGASILASARSVREDLQILHRQGELEGFDRQYQAQRQQVGKRLAELVTEVKKTRADLSRRTGIAENDLALPPPPPPPGSFNTPAPPVPVR
jgi:hypothetical protein